MKQQQNIHSEDLIELSREGYLLTDRDIPVYPGSQSLKRNNEFGKFNYNVEQLSNFSLVEWDSLFNIDTNIEGQVTMPAFSLRFMLDGITRYKTDRMETEIRRGECNIWSVNDVRTDGCRFKKDVNCRFFGVMINNEYLKTLAHQHPDLLSDLYTRYSNGETFLFNKKQLSINAEMNLIISQIKNAQLIGSIKELYLEAKIIELLALQLQANHDNPDHTNAYAYFKKRDVDKIHEAREILLSHINNPPSIQDLAKQVGINDKKLKYGFKEVYNQTVYGCLFDYKMNMARQLLQETEKTINEVALECGYEYASHFSTAFKRKYGISPKMFKN